MEPKGNRVRAWRLSIRPSDAITFSLADLWP